MFLKIKHLFTLNKLLFLKIKYSFTLNKPLFLKIKALFTLNGALFLKMKAYISAATVKIPLITTHPVAVPFIISHFAFDDVSS